MSLLFDTSAVVRRPVGVVRVTGEDRQSYLHTLLSQHLEQARPGQAADFLYLDPKGNAIAAGRVLVRADELLLLTEPVVAPELAQRLDAMRFMLRVEVADVSGGHALASVRGGDATAPGEPMTFSEDGGGVVLHDRSGGVDLFGEPAWVDQQLAERGLPEAGEQDWQAWRILQGMPAWGTEIAPGRRAQELGLLPTHVHLKKGCYPGQESIAKTWNLGRPRRALAVLELDSEPAGSVQVGDAEARVTSAAPHQGRWVALALLPVDEHGTVPGPVTQPNGTVLHKVGDGMPIPGA